MGSTTGGKGFRDWGMVGKEVGSKELDGKGVAGECLSGVVESEDVIDEEVARENICVASEAGNDLGKSDTSKDLSTNRAGKV